MTRLTMKNLIPSQGYYVQIRAVGEKETSPWSRKFSFNATDDDVPPKVPANFTWTAANGYFTATWDEVTKNVDESNSRIIRYNLKLTGNGVVEGIQLLPSESTDGGYTYKLTYERARVLFGRNVTEITAAVRAVNKGSIKGAYTAPIFASLATPDPPTNPVVDEVNDGLNVSWDAPVNMTNVDGYRMWLSTSGPGFTPTPQNMVYEGTAINATYNTTTYQLHYIKIRSFSRWGTESIDCVTQGTPKSPYGADVIPPDVPSSFFAALDRTGPVARALLSWNFNDTVDPNKDISNFAIRFKKVSESGDSWRLVFADKAARSAAVDLPEPFANYEFQIASIDTLANYSAWSPSALLDAGIPGNPTTPTVTAAAGLGSIQLNWTTSSDDVTYGGYYEVTIAKDSGFTTSPLTYKTGNTSISVTGLDIGATYYYRVKAVDTDANSSSWSTTASIVTSDLTGGVPITDGAAPTSSPTPVLSPGINSLFISWSPIANGDTVTYEIHLSTSSSSGFAKVGETSGTVMTITRDAAGAALSYVPYYARIIAKDYDGAASISTSSSAATPRKAGTGDIISIIADQIATSSLSTSTITIDGSGDIRSNNYVANTTGFKISAAVVDIQSGTINFGTLRAGTVTTTGLSIGAGGRITVDSTGSVQSNNYAAGVSGWKLASSGLELNDGTVKASAMSAGTYTGGNFIVGSGGNIRSSNYNFATKTGWIISDTSFEMYSGSITGASVATNQLRSITTSADAPNGYVFSINPGGYAEFAGVRSYGNMIVGNSSSHMISSGNYSPGSAGWRIYGSGTAEFNGPTLNAGNITGSSFQTSLNPGGGPWSTNTYINITDGVQRFMYAGTTYGMMMNSYSGLNIYGGDAGLGNYHSLLQLPSNNGEQRLILSTYGPGHHVSIGTAGEIFLNSDSVKVDSLKDGGSQNTNAGAKYVRCGPAGALTSWTTGPSSREIKHDIGDLEIDINQVLKMRTVSYRMNETPLEKRAGFIAEEVDELGLELLVGYKDEENKETPAGFDYDGMDAVLLKVDQYQEERIDAQAREIAELKELVNSLVERLDK